MVAEKLSREERANREIGVTEISRRGAMFLALSFLLVIYGVPLTQLAIDINNQERFLFELPDVSGEHSLQSKVITANKQLLKGFDQLEGDLEEGSFLRELFLPPLQYVFSNYLKQGNEKVVHGDSGYLFYRPAVDYLIGPPFLDRMQIDRRLQSHALWEQPVQPDPVMSIRAFHEQLAARNIELVLLPVPVKAAIIPSSLSLHDVQKPLANRSWNTFIKQLQEAGVLLLDIRDILYTYHVRTNDGYLKTDTHWSPAAMKSVANRLAQFLITREPALRGDANYAIHRSEHGGPGDLGRMLLLPQKSSSIQTEEVIVDQVIEETGMIWQPDKQSPILLLGDSFTNIYSSSGLQLGAGGGLAEHLSLYLQRPVDVLARNDDGAYSSREMLAVEMQRGRDRLAGKRFVIWEFAERELSHGDWKMIPLMVGTALQSSFVSLAAGSNPIHVSGTVDALSESPRPGTVPYRDNVVTLHLVDLEGEQVSTEQSQALVYGFGMRDNKLTELARLRPGDRVSMLLSSWDDVEIEYGSYRRTSLDDEMIELELPNWGVINDKKSR